MLKGEFNQVEAQLKQNKEMAAKVEQATTENKENLDMVSAITEVLIAWLFLKTAVCLLMLQQGSWVHQVACQGTRYVNGDIIAMPYPFDTNPKWPKGTLTIFKFQMQATEGLHMERTVAC